MEDVSQGEVQHAVYGMLGHQDQDQVVASAGQMKNAMAYHLSASLVIRESTVNKPHSNMIQYHFGLFSSTKTN